MRTVFSRPVEIFRAQILGAHLKVRPPWAGRATLAGAALAAVIAPAAHADVHALGVTSVDVTEASGAADVFVRLKDAGTKPEFSLFRLANPTRVVIDIPRGDVTGIRVPQAYDADALVSGVTTTQFRGREGPVGRVVVVMRGDIELETRAEAGAVVVKARKSEGARAEAPKSSAGSAPSATSQEQPVIELTGDPSPSIVANAVLGVEAREQGDGSLVHIRTNGEVKRYEVEEARDPTRLVIDLYGVALERSADRSFEGTAVSRARTWSHPDHVRVVLDARGALPTYNVASTGEGLTVLFKSRASTAESSKPSARLRTVAMDEKQGFWRVRGELGAAVSVRTVKNAPGEKVIALDGVRAADAILGARGLVGGPVKDVVVQRDDARPDSVRIKLLVDSEVEHSVWQRDGVLYWDVRQGSSSLAAAAVPGVPGAPNGSSRAERVQPTAAPFSIGPVTLAREGAAAATFKGKKITIDLQDADIVNVIRLIGDVSGKNVVVAEEVKGKVTLKLKNVPWDQALDIILKTKDLGQETKGGIIRVVPQAKLDAEREARLRLQDEREKKLPTTVRLIPVNYAVAREMQTQVAGILSARGKVSVDDRTNVIIVEDIRDNLDQAERLVRTLDTQTPQVLIEARMVEGSTTFSRSLGIQWGGGFFMSQRGGNPTGLMFPSSFGVVGAADQPSDAQLPGVVAPPNFAVNLPSQQGGTSAVGLNLGSLGNFGFVNARLTAAEASGQARIISAPRVTTLNNKRARITQGTNITVPIATQNALSVQTVQAALQLDVTPHVTADGSILMEINLTNNTPDFGQAQGGPPPVQTKEAQTELLVRDGDTAVIGGIYTRQQGEAIEQTPILGSLPILGWLFKSVAEQDARTEMLVFITPRIVNRRSAIPTAGGLGSE